MNNLILNNLIIGRSPDMPLRLVINYDFAQKNIYYIKGNNGSGKTTLMRTICGYLRPIAGDISDKNPFETSAYYGHDGALKQKMIVSEYINFCVQMFDNTTCPSELIELFYLNSLLNMPIASLSCGQKKRVSLVGFLVCNRDIYCFDEASAGLDTHFQNIFYNYLQMLAYEKNKIILFSDHINPNLPQQIEVNLENF